MTGSDLSPLEDGSWATAPLVIGIGGSIAPMDNIDKFVSKLVLWNEAILEFDPASFQARISIPISGRVLDMPAGA